MYQWYYRQMALIRTSLIATLLTLSVSVGNVALAEPVSAPGGSWIYSANNTAPSRGRLGVKVVSISPELRTHFGASRDAGLLVDSVFPASAAAIAGIKTGDIIIELDGTAIASSVDMIRMVNSVKEDAILRVTLVRRGKKLKVKARLESPTVLVPFLDTDPRGKSPFSSSPHGHFDRLREYRMPFPPNFEFNEDLLRRIEELETRMESMAKRMPPKTQKRKKR